MLATQKTRRTGRSRVMMFCPSCGRQVSDEARFCPGCGRSLEPSAPRPPRRRVHARARRAALAAGLVAAIVALVAAVALLVPRLLSDSPELQDRTSSNAATGGRATAADGYCYFYDDAASSIDRMRMDGSPAADAETVYALDEGHVAHYRCASRKACSTSSIRTSTPPLREREARRFTPWTSTEAAIGFSTRHSTPPTT